jgi:hypothetical protein
MGWEKILREKESVRIFSSKLFDGFRMLVE